MTTTNKTKIGVTHDGLKLCDDCTIAAVNGDFTGLDYHYSGGDDPEGEACKRQAEIVAGLERLGALGHLVCESTEDDDDGPGFSWSPCACCESRLGGNRTMFVILGPVEK